MKRLLLLTVALIFYGSLFPWHFNWHTPENPLHVLAHSWPTVVDRWLLRDIVINLLLYFPLGLAAFLSFARGHSRAAAAVAALLIGLGLSTSVELLQVYVPGRVCSLSDILCNFIGTAAGVLAGWLAGPRIEHLTKLPVRRQASAAALLLGCWATAQAFPFFPALSQTKVRHTLEAFWHGFPLSPVEVWANSAEWFAAALAVRAIVGRLRWHWPAAALCVLIARFIIAARGLTPDELVGALLAALLWTTIPERWKLRTGAWSLGSALVLRELAPFHFSAPPQKFSWIPFVPTLDSERELAAVVLARKAFDYGALIWLLRRTGFGYLRPGIAVAAALLLFELAQVYLPGRTPEITDSVVALLMVIAFWRIDR